MPTDDVRMGESLRALRRRAGLRQMDLARLAGVSRRTIGRIEMAQAGGLTLDTLRRVFDATDARVRQVVIWNGASLDRLLDARHAKFVELVLALLRAYGWRTEVEVTFASYGERGSIDILAGHDPTRSGLVIEVKSAIGSVEETNRTLDMKVRLASRAIVERFGWQPTSVSRLLVLPEERASRRIVSTHALTIDSVYPARNWQVRRWLRRPEGGAIRGILFLSEGRGGAIDSARR